MSVLKTTHWDFPGGPVYGNVPSNAGDESAIPAQGTKIPHATEQLSPRATATSPHAATTEAHVPRPCAPQQEKPLQ